MGDTVQVHFRVSRTRSPDIAAWLDAQNNISESIRCLIRQAYTAAGPSDMLNIISARSAWQQPQQFGMASAVPAAPVDAAPPVRRRKHARKEPDAAPVSGQPVDTAPYDEYGAYADRAYGNSMRADTQPVQQAPMQDSYGGGGGFLDRISSDDAGGQASGGSDPFGLLS